MNGNDRPKAAAAAAAEQSSTHWRPLRRPPRSLWVRCARCRWSTINEDRHLRGWQESVRLPRVYICGECAEEVGT